MEEECAEVSGHKKAPRAPTSPTVPSLQFSALGEYETSEEEEPYDEEEEGWVQDESAWDAATMGSSIGESHPTRYPPGVH